MDLATQTERSILKFPKPGYPGPGLPGMALSPDGSTLVLQVWADHDQQLAKLVTVRTDGGGYREIYGPFPAPFLPSVVEWTPDGESILFFTTPSDGKWRLMRISAEGGQPEFDGLDYARAAASTPDPPLASFSPLSLDVSPDGSRIAFGAHRSPPVEVWLLENVKALLQKR